MRELGALSSSTERRSALLMLGRCEVATAMPGFLERLALFSQLVGGLHTKNREPGMVFSMAR